MSIIYDGFHGDCLSVSFDCFSDSEYNQIEDLVIFLLNDAK